MTVPRVGSVPPVLLLGHRPIDVKDTMTLTLWLRTCAVRVVAAVSKSPARLHRVEENAVSTYAMLLNDDIAWNVALKDPMLPWNIL